MTDPLTKTSLISFVREVHTEISDYVSGLDEEKFHRNPPSGWSPENNINHLVKSEKIVILGLHLPNFLMRLMYGSGRKYDNPKSMVDTYWDKTGRGETAGITAKPLFLWLKNTRKGAKQKKLIQSFKNMGLKLENKIQGYSEENLIALRLPHPILGNLSIGEMVYFLQIHNLHHFKIMKDRLTKN